MRGSRVKNIVQELHGEKIDIVRYSDDIKEYIQAALSPAEISQIQLNTKEKKANIIVAEDQLSLAIGKHGQNVRLASQLVGWELDLFSAAQWKEYQDQPKPEAAEAQPAPAAEEEETEEVIEEISLRSLTGVGEKLAADLETAGFDDLDKVAGASVEDLTQIKGLGKIKAQKMIDEAKGLLAESEEVEVEEDEKE
jgi:N utilization substance protein A